KFGLAPDAALAALAEALALGIDIAGVHFHVGSQLARVEESLVAVDRLVAFCERADEELGWQPRLLDIGGGLGIRYTREEHVPDGVFRIAGKHCESGDVLIDAIALPHPRRGDLLAVPATGAYTLAMASTYNGVPNPAAVLVADGHARVVRARQPVSDLLRFER